eukprot:9077443-Pyramimonas_sp.AAC.1
MAQPQDKVGLAKCAKHAWTTEADTRRPRTCRRSGPPEMAGDGRTSAGAPGAGGCRRRAKHHGGGWRGER